MNSIAGKLEFVNMIAGESELKWHDAKQDPPKDVRDYIVFVGHTDCHGVKRGFITYGHWAGHGWEIFNQLDRDDIPHITHWIEWFPAMPDGYEEED